MRRLLLCVALAWLWAGGAYAQNVVQTGTVTPRHATMWSTNGVVMDAGTSGGGALGANPTTFGVTATGTPFCVTDVATTSPYHQLCFGASSLGGGLISFNAFNGATQNPLQFNVNGSTFAAGPGVPTPVVNGDCLIGSGGAAIWGSCSGSGSNVTSVTGTAGQITASPTTGAVVVSLPATITSNETFSGALTFTGSVAGSALTSYLAAPAAIGGTTPAAGAFTTLSASSTLTTNVTGSTQCLHANASGVVSGTGADCGSGSGAVTSVSGTTGQIAVSPTTGAVVVSLPATITSNETLSGTVNITGSLQIGGITVGLPITVPNGGTGLTTLTSNVIYKGNSSSPLSASALTDNGTVVSSSESLDLVSNGYANEFANDGTTGTTLNKLAKLTSSGKAIITVTTDTDGAIGLVIGGAGVTGNAQIAANGQANCVFDGATTAGDYVVISSTTGGDCHDNGASRPLGSQSIGQVLSSNAAGGTYALALSLSKTNTAGGGSGTVNSGTSGQVAYYAATGTAVSGNPNVTVSSGALTLGQVGSVLGDLILSGNTSGAITIQPQAAAGTYNFNLPTTVGTAGQLLTSQAGGTAAMTWTSPTVTVAGQSCTLGSTCSIAIGNLSSIAGGTVVGNNTTSSAAPTATISPVLGIPATSTGTLGLANGGATGATVIVQNNGATTAYNFNLPTTAGTAGQLLTSQAGGTSAMTWTSPSVTVSGQTCTLGGSCTIAAGGLANIAGGTVIGNNTGSTGAPAASAAPVLGIAASTAGTLGIANGGASGAIVTVQNNGATSAYNFNLPTTAGSSGQFLTSAAGGTSAMTWDNISAHLTQGTGITLSGTTNVTVGLTTASANTMKGNWTGSTANVVDNSMPGCSDTTGNHLNYVSGTGITCGTSVTTATAFTTASLIFTSFGGVQ